MKAIKIGLILLLIFNSSLYSQNFKLFELNEPKFYSCSNNTFSGLKIENDTSVTDINGNVETRYFNYKWNFDNQNTLLKTIACNFSIMDSWVGKYISSYVNGKYVFYNKNSDSIIINTDTAIHNWILYSLPQNGSITASFNRMLSNDSLLVIELTVNAIVFDSVLNQINNSRIILSKKNGILKALDFLEFPQKYIVYSQIDKVDLDSSIFGLGNVYNFKVGDKLQYYQLDNVIPGSYKVHTYTDINILTKSGLKYIVRKKELKMEMLGVTGHGNSDRYTYKSTIDTVDYSNFINNDMPNRVSPSVYKASNISTTGLSFDSILNKFVRSELEFNCSFAYNEYGDEKYAYLSNAGIFKYTRRASQLFPVEVSKTLVYYKSNVKTRGDSIDFKKLVDQYISNVGINYLDRFISVFPNPSSNSINILSGDTLENIIVINTDGKVVLDLENIENSINIEELPIGMYMLKAISPNGKIYSTRFIKSAN